MEGESVCVCVCLRERERKQENGNRNGKRMYIHKKKFPPTPSWEKNSALLEKDSNLLLPRLPGVSLSLYLNLGSRDKKKERVYMCPGGWWWRYY